MKDRKSERGCNQVMPWGSVAAPGEAIARRLVSSTVEKTLLAALAALDSGGRKVQFAGRRPPADVRICANRVPETTWKSIGGAERT